MATEEQRTGFVKGGELTIRGPKQWAVRDGEVTVHVRRAYATRSSQQNRWYWSQVVGLVSKHTGYTPDEVHEIYKAKFLPRVVEIVDFASGEMVAEFKIGGSTAHLDTQQFSEYCEQIREWAATLPNGGVVIPDPDPEMR